MPEPSLPDDITAGGLDAEVRRDLRGLQRDTAESVARHLVAAGRLVDEEPRQALEHARFARSRASRIAVVREAAGIAAYHAGEWAEALGELRAARRMGGGPGHLAVMADIERALGRPERALELSRGPEVRSLDRAEAIELAIVAAGARRDLGEIDASVVSLQIPELDAARRDPWSTRLFYAYADNLLAAGRESDALQWFVHAADADEDGETDAARRIAELTGEPVPEDEFAFGLEEAVPAATDGDESDAEDSRADPARAASTDAGADDTDAGADDTDAGADDTDARADDTDASADDTDASADDTDAGAGRPGVDDDGADDGDGDARDTDSDHTGVAGGRRSDDTSGVGTRARDAGEDNVGINDTGGDDAGAADTGAGGPRADDDGADGADGPVAEPGADAGSVPERPDPAPAPEDPGAGRG